MGALFKTQQNSQLRHYHGNVVRSLFVTNSVVLLIAFPIFKTEAIIPVFFGTILVITLILLAALTTSKYGWIHTANMVVALLCVGIFEILAFATDFSTDPLVFLIRQGIALSFLLALYFSARTVLGVFSQNKPTPHLAEETKEPVVSSETTNEELLQEIKEKNEQREELK